MRSVCCVPKVEATQFRVAPIAILGFRHEVTKPEIPHNLIFNLWIQNIARAPIHYESSCSNLSSPFSSQTNVQHGE